MDADMDTGLPAPFDPSLVPEDVDPVLDQADPAALVPTILVDDDTGMVTSSTAAWHDIDLAGHDAPADVDDRDAGGFSGDDGPHGMVGYGAGQFHADHTGHVTGTPAHDMQYWHQQHYRDTCAICSQEFVLDAVGVHLSEDQLRQEALAHGWYQPGGTPLNCIGDLLQLHGVNVAQEQNASFEELAHRLASGEHVIVAVNAEEIWSDRVIPGQGVDHAVEVIGIDTSNPGHPMVILNDSGCSGGRGELVPLDVFQSAWGASHDFLVATV